MIRLCDVQAVRPQGCVCYNPNVLDSNNSTVVCNTTHCSRGNNLNCYGRIDNAFPTIYALRAFGVSTVFVDFLGCNCPGYNFSNYTINNAIGLDSYNYSDCNGFGDESQDDDLIYCCSYCCGLPPVYTTTSVPSATISVRTFPISILFSFVFMLIKMIEPDTFQADLSVLC